MFVYITEGAIGMELLAVCDADRSGDFFYLHG